MPKFLFVSTLIIFLISGLRVGNSANSTFGTLVDEKSANREILEFDGQNLDDYKKSLDDYEKLFAAYEKSYGPQRALLESQVIAKAKDTVIAKLGATKSFLENLQVKLNELDLLTPEENTAYTSGVEGYMAFVSAANVDLEKVETLGILPVYSQNVNKELFNKIQFAERYLARISVVRGQYIIERIMGLAPVIQAQINTSADVGGDVAQIQKNLDSAMLNLESVKDRYADTASQLNNLGAPTGKDFDIMNTTRVDNAKVDQAYKEIVKVVADLRALYLQAPWDEKLVEQLLYSETSETNEESIEDSSSSMEMIKETQ